MSTEILVNAGLHESRAAVVDKGVLLELFLERASRRGLISNIYKGRVSRVLPGMQAAFIEIGMERTAFLHASDIFDPRHADLGLEAPRTDNIRALIAEGNEVLVQVVKDPLGTKGARLTTYITLPSRYLVYMPQSQGVGVSARIEEEAERERLRSAVRAGLQADENAGYIVRTAAEDAPPEALLADMQYLRKLWQVVRHKGLRTQPGNLVHAHRSTECLSGNAGFRRHVHARGEIAPGTVRGRPASVRIASCGGGNPEGLGPQGIAEVGRLRDHRSDRVHDPH